MKFVDFLKDKFIFIVVSVFTLGLITALLFVFDSHFVLKIYIPFLLFSLGIIVLLFDFFRKKNFYNNVASVISELDKKFLITEILSEPDFLEGKLFYSFLYDTNKSMLENINFYKNNKNELKEYIELWCHEVKTPVATAQLIVENNKNDITENINEELVKIDNYIEQILFYAKSEYVEKDYIIKELNLESVVNSVLKRNKKDLISKKITIEIFDINNVVNSDFKWLEFILNQIISNSIKYSKNQDAKIKIYSVKNKDNIELFIEDNGIGISSDEVGRVFDKGFTGNNGRKKYNSTGIGLYLCKKLCDRLGHGLYIDSKINTSTVVKIVFPISSSIKSIIN